ncbi:EamA-like transporter family protein [Roseiarcus fermentans]|uniref:EamA-like transporter family protein n=1 Tax=Roseiarcus fermentans TaxID=1473586 RepID=A0A366F395_9HYPH|nr:DMT family transporter [Roseiarcus fermentans]RBP09132.1 EamA-like transporter family protein [Roseiarcus fermentans]
MQNAALFLATVLVWGATWIAIAMQVGPVPVLVSIFYRFVIAALVVIAALAVTGRLSVPERRHHPWLLAQAVCLFCMNFVCFYNAAGLITSGLISVIFSLATVYNAINGRIFFGDRFTGRALVAAVLGAGGLALLFGRDLFVTLDARALMGVGLAALGTLFFSLGNMVSRRNSKAGLSPATANAWGMTYGAALLLMLILVTRTPIVAPPDARYVWALLFLGIFGSAFAFTAYLLLVARVGSARAAYATVLFPIVALSISTVFEGYRWTWPGALGLALCLFGNVVMFAPARFGRFR